MVQPSVRRLILSTMIISFVSGFHQINPFFHHQHYHESWNSRISTTGTTTNNNKNNKKSFLVSSIVLSESNNNNNNSNEDFYESSNNMQEEQEAGQALAHEFYEQLKIRQMRDELESSETKGKTIMKPLDASSSSSSDSDDERITTAATANKDKKNKFTGRQGEIDSTGTPSAGLFAQSNESVYGFPVQRQRSNNNYSSRASSVQEQMMRSEFNLVSFAGGERSILIQLSLALALLGAVLYVGFTGGITDGSERIVLETDDFNDVVTQTILNNDATTDATVMDEIIRTTQSGSIWL